MTILSPNTLTCTIAATGVAQPLSATPKYARGATLYAKSTNNAAGVFLSTDGVAFVPPTAAGMAAGTEWELPVPPAGGRDTVTDLSAWQIKGTLNDIVYVIYY